MYGRVGGISPEDVWSYKLVTTTFGGTSYRTTGVTNTPAVITINTDYGSIMSGDWLVINVKCNLGTGIIHSSRACDDPVYPNEQILDPGFDPTPYKDFNPITYATPATNPIPAGATIPLVQYDFGTVRRAIGMIIHYWSRAHLNLEMSSDCSTYTTYQISASTSQVYTQRLFVLNSRCLRLSVYNYLTVDIPASDVRIHALEFYEPRLIADSFACQAKRTVFFSHMLFYPELDSPMVDCIITYTYF